ncbi:hypothetical protein GE21DRAFT_1006109 [Neurospora crassa]|nr:hypothetical protein GE21DRAFT_1006109 [Neurospora crassa]
MDETGKWPKVRGAFPQDFPPQLPFKLPPDMQDICYLGWLISLFVGGGQGSVTATIRRRQRRRRRR